MTASASHASVVLAEQPLAAHRVQGHEQGRLQQALRRDAVAASPAVHRVEHRGELDQRLVRERLHRAQRMVLGHALLGGSKAQHRGLLLLGPAHAGEETTAASESIAGADKLNTLLEHRSVSVACENDRLS